MLAKRLGDGRVEVGVQQREGEDGGWGERLLPDARFLAADAEADVWLGSSPVAVSAPAAPAAAVQASDPRSTPRVDIVADARHITETGALAPGQPVICVVSDTHGDDLERICDTLRELHDGEVTTLSSPNPAGADRADRCGAGGVGRCGLHDRHEICRPRSWPPKRLDRPASGDRSRRSFESSGPTATRTTICSAWSAMARAAPSAPPTRSGAGWGCPRRRRRATSRPASASSTRAATVKRRRSRSA